MQEKNKMTPEQVRRHRRKVERMRRERARVRRNKTILALVLLIIGFFLIKGIAGVLKDKLPKKNKSDKTTTATKETDNNATDTNNNEEISKETYKGLDTSKLTVCLDPGHGGDDKGATNGDIEESSQMLEIAGLIKAEFEKYGVNVVLTRTDDSFMFLNPRSQVANDNNADVFISLHRDGNAESSDSSEVGIYIDKDADKATESFAESIYKKVKKVNGMEVSNVKYGSIGDEGTNYVVIDGISMPGCLVNFGSISSDLDNENYETNKSKYAKAIVDGTLKYLSEKNDESESETESENTAE